MQPFVSLLLFDENVKKLTPERLVRGTNRSGLKFPITLMQICHDDIWFVEAPAHESCKSWTSWRELSTTEFWHFGSSLLVPLGKLLYSKLMKDISAYYNT